MSDKEMENSEPNENPEEVQQAAAAGDTPQDLINALLKSNKVVVFSKSYCPFCVDVKKVLKKHTKDFHVVELDKRQDGSTLQKLISKKSKISTVPQVFVDGKFVGDCSKVKSLSSSGKLQTILAAKE